MGDNALKLIDNLEVCRRIGVKPDTWRKRVERGDSPLPFTRQGARTYYRERDVNFYLRKGLWPASMRFKGKAASEVESLHPAH